MSFRPGFAILLPFLALPGKDNPPRWQFHLESALSIQTTTLPSAGIQQVMTQFATVQKRPKV